MSSTQWDKMGSIYSGTYPQNIPNAINNRVPFMLAKDAARNVPANPGDWNDSVEELRVKGLDILQAVTTPVAWVFGKLDEATDGGASKLLSAGYKNVRSNYAFTRDVANKNAALGLLSGLFTTSGAIMGGVVGFGLGGPIGAAAGASVGGSIFGTLQRDTAKTEYVKKTANILYRSAKLAETDAGQESYNFGRDVVGFTSRVTGVKTLGDTSKGIGAITSGLLNFGFELATAPDIGLAKGVGAVGRRALNAPIDEVGTGIVSGRLTAKSAEEAAVRFAEDIDILKRTAAGEVTKYTPVFKFYRENSPAVVAQRAEFRGGDIPQIASHLVAGADDATISLILRIGRYDDTAIKELDTLSAAKLAEYTRVDDAIKVAEQGGISYVSYKGQLITANQLAPTGLSYLKKELDSLQKEVQWFRDAEIIQGGLTSRTASKWSWVERVRNDIAKERAARKLELSKAGILPGSRNIDDLNRETTFGGVIQGVYQRSPFSVFVRWFDRATDDAPRGTVNFSDRILASDRLRANIRSSVQYGGLKADDGLKLYNDFITAGDEVTKFNLIQNYTKNLAENLGDKYGLSGLTVSLVLQKYDELHNTIVGAARDAKINNRGYMIDPNGDVIKDPQLISQLANGAYLPDPKMWDKAFKDYSKKYGKEASFPIKAAIGSKFIADEFLSLWRGFTLARGGYPLNIIRDSAIRMLGDGALFPALKILSTDALYSITNFSNTPAKIKSAVGQIDPKKNLSNIREDIAGRDAYIIALEKALDEAKVDLTQPLSSIPTNFQKHVKNLNDMKATVAALRAQENAIISKTPPVKRVSKDKIMVQGYDFPAASSGRFGDISMQQLRMRDDMRRAVASIREIETGNIRASRTGSRSITPTENEQLHLTSWMLILKDQVGNDAVARLLMQGKTKKDIRQFLRNTTEGQEYMARMGLRPSDTNIVYTRVAEVIKQFAPNKQLHDLILANDVTIDSLRRLYPDINQRPVVLTDLSDDMLGRSNAYRKGKAVLDETVTWLSTAPTTKLMYAPYFAFKYQHKLQNLVHLANIQGKRLTLDDKQKFERIARNFAITEYRNKLNSFHRDMNYSGLINYAIAFFPAIVEQFRAYGRITLDNPDFILKAAAIKELPERVLQVEEDPFGTEYVEVELPILGLTGRLPVDWFNPFNPTGSTLIGAGPILSASWNEYVKRSGGESALEDKITNWILPFGASSSSLNALLPNTIRRTAQVIAAGIGAGGGPSQFNKDVNMFMKQALADFYNENHRNPSALELRQMVTQSEERSTLLATVRALSAFTLPAQPRYVTALQPYADELAKMREADPINGEEDFIYMNPDLFFLADSLSNSLAGLRSDDTAVSLVKRNPEMVKDLVAILGEDNIGVLGAIFNDDSYSFSSKAQAWLESSKIPYLNKKFKEYGEPLEGAKSSVVNRGWQDWNRFMESVKQQVATDPQQPYNPNRGFGATVVDYYKQQYLEEQKVKNPLWYEEYANGYSGAGAARSNRLVDALTYAINDDKMWNDLSQNPRWFAVVQYLNFRYDIYDELNMLGTTIDSNRAAYLREDVEQFVDNLKRQSPDFGLFYERYFRNDKFDHVGGK